MVVEGTIPRVETGHGHEIDAVRTAPKRFRLGSGVLVTISFAHDVTDSKELSSYQN